MFTKSLVPYIHGNNLFMKLAIGEHQQLDYSIFCQTPCSV
jgi:hypothetical protein